jgi:hypothetical protein
MLKHLAILIVNQEHIRRPIDRRRAKPLTIGSHPRTSLFS